MKHFFKRVAAGFNLRSTAAHPKGCGYQNFNGLNKMSKKGYLLPLVIIYMIISMIVGAGILVLGSMDRIESNKRLHREQAFYLAEAGINLARYNLKISSSWQPTNPYSLGLGNFQLIVDNTTSNTMIFVTSTGTVKGVHETTAIIVAKGGTFTRGTYGSNQVYMHNNALVDSYDSRLGLYGSGSPPNKGADGDISSGKILTMENNADVFGDVAGGNTVMVNNNAHVFGDAAGGSTIVDPLNGITGTKTYNSFERAPLLPVVIPEDLSTMPYTQWGDPRITPSSNYTLVNGTLTVTKNTTVTITGGNFHFKNFIVGSTTGNNDTLVRISSNIRFYVENDLILYTNTTLRLPGGELYVGTGTSGAILMENNSDLQNTGSPTDFGIFIASTEDQMFSNNSVELSAAIYAPLATVYLRENAILYGDVVANEVILRENAEIHYDIALKDTQPPGDTGLGGSPKFISWTKPDWKR